MNRPPLPEVFGNYALKDFSEVVAPAAISWWPQTVGWLLVAAVLAFYLCRWLWRRAKHWYRNRYRREARQRLMALRNGPQFIAEVNQVLKLAAMAAYTRPKVAGLSGEQWLAFLNAQVPAATFGADQAELLALAQYRQQQVDDATAASLAQSAQRWLSSHREAQADA